VVSVVDQDLKKENVIVKEKLRDVTEYVEVESVLMSAENVMEMVLTSKKVHAIATVV